MEKLPGPVRAAILLLALGERDGAPIWQALTDPEVRTVAMIMAHLGSVSKVALLKTAAEFVQQVSASDFAGNPAITEKLLLSTLPRNRAKGIIEEIKVPTSPDLWDRLAYIRPEQLSVFLKNEYPQTAAVVLSYLRSEQAARVLARLPTDFAAEEIQSKKWRISSILLNQKPKVVFWLHLIVSIEMHHKNSAHLCSCSKILEKSIKTPLRFS